MDVVTAVEVLHDRVVRLTFDDGFERVIDLAPYLNGPVFAEFREDLEAFAAVEVDHDVGTIVWPNGADLAPETLYAGLPPIKSKAAGDHR